MISSAPLIPAGPSERFAIIIGALQRSVADNGHRLKIHGPLLVLIGNYLSTLIARFAKIAARPPQSPRPRKTAAREPTPKPKPALTLSRGFAWLIRLLPSSPAGPIVAGAHARLELQHFMEDPTLQALLATHPSLGRILRPLHTMLGLRHPPAIKRPKSTKPRPTRPRTPKRKPDVRANYNINPDRPIAFTPAQHGAMRGPPWHQPVIPSCNIKKIWRQGP